MYFYDLATPSKTLKHMHQETRMFTTPLSQMAKYPSTIVLINILLCIQTMGYYIAVKDEGTTATYINTDEFQLNDKQKNKSKKNIFTILSTYLELLNRQN